MFGKKFKTILAIGAMAAALISAGCGSDSTTKNGIPPVIRLGSETTFAPFEFVDGDKFVGFDLDLAEAVIKQMGSKMEFKSMGFDALIPAVQSGQIDMIAAGMDATPERAKQVAFSDVYFDDNGYVIVTRKDTDTIHDWKDLEGKSVGGQIGSKAIDLAKKVNAGNIKQFDSNSQGFMELQASTLDAVIIDYPVAMYKLKQGADKDLQIVGTPYKAPGMSLAVNKDNKELQDAVNKALKEIKENGTYDKIYKKWFGEQQKQ